MNLTKLVQKLANGDHLSDGELVRLRYGYTYAIDALSVFKGERYELTRWDMALKLEQVESFLRARGVLK